MSVDWDDPKVNVSWLLISTNPLERVKGQVYHILRTNQENTKTGDELFLELARDLVLEGIGQVLSGFIGEPIFINDSIDANMNLRIKQAITDVTRPYLSKHFDFQVSTRVCPSNPTHVQVNYVYKTSQATNNVTTKLIKE